VIVSVPTAVYVPGQDVPFVPDKLTPQLKSPKAVLSLTTTVPEVGLGPDEAVTVTTALTRVQ
jgi:hypothetical protein